MTRTCVAVAAALSAACTSTEITDLDWRLHDDVGAMAYVSWTQSTAEDVTIEFSTESGVWQSTPVFEGQEGVNEQLLVGIPFDFEADWRVVPDGADPIDGEPIVTAAAPDELPVPTLEASQPEAWLPGGNFLLTSVSRTNGGWSSPGPFYTVLLDRMGRPVWFRRTPRDHWTLYATVARAGDHILYDEFEFFGGGEEVVFPGPPRRSHRRAAGARLPPRLRRAPRREHGVALALPHLSGRGSGGARTRRHRGRGDLVVRG